MIELDYDRLEEEEDEDGSKRYPNGLAQRIRDSDIAAAALPGIIARVMARLEDLLRGHRERAAAGATLPVDRRSFDPSPEGELMRRYEMACNRTLLRTYDSLHKKSRRDEPPGRESEPPDPTGPFAPDLGSPGGEGKPPCQPTGSLWQRDPIPPPPIELAASGQRLAAEVDLPTGTGTTASTLSHSHDGSIDAGPSTGAIAIISPMEPTVPSPELSHDAGNSECSEKASGGRQPGAMKDWA